MLNKPGRTFGFWYGAGETVAGFAEMYTGIAAAVAGGGGTIGGGVLTPFTGGTSLAISAVGVTGVVAGMAIAAQGGSNMMAGISIMMHERNRSGSSEELPEGTHKIVDEEHLNLDQT